jgi:hypothetical protein
VADYRPARRQVYLENQPNMLDQFLVNRNMATGDAAIKVDPWSVQIPKLPAMVNPVSIRSRSSSEGWASRSINRRSDHFLVAMTVTEYD